MDIPEWILQDRPPSRPTEIFVPVKLGIVPISSYDGSGDGWQGEMWVELLGEYAGNDCGHNHPTQDEAWACIESKALDAARKLAEGAMAR